MKVGKHRGSIGAVLAVLVLGGCSTNTVDLSYDSSTLASESAVATNSVKILSVSDG